MPESYTSHNATWLNVLLYVICPVSLRGFNSDLKTSNPQGRVHWIVIVLDFPDQCLQHYGHWYMQRHKLLSAHEPFTTKQLLHYRTAVFFLYDSPGHSWTILVSRFEFASLKEDDYDNVSSQGCKLSLFLYVWWSIIDYSSRSRLNQSLVIYDWVQVSAYSFLMGDNNMGCKANKKL